MSLIARLVEFVTDTAGLSADEAAWREGDRTALAAAALLVHVARVDGRWTGAERARLIEGLRARFGLPVEVAARLTERADAVDREAGDVAALVEMMGHGVDPDERRRLLVMAYSVAAADGRLEEVEDALVWRVGRLLGFDEVQIREIRSGAAPPAGMSA